MHGENWHRRSWCESPFNKFWTLITAFTCCDTAFWWKMLFGFLSKFSKNFSKFLFLWTLENMLVNLAIFSSKLFLMQKDSCWLQYNYFDSHSRHANFYVFWSLSLDFYKLIGSECSSFSHRISKRRWGSTSESTWKTVRLCRNIRWILPTKVVQENMQSWSEI